MNIFTHQRTLINQSAGYDDEIIEERMTKLLGQKIGITFSLQTYLEYIPNVNFLSGAHIHMSAVPDHLSLLFQRHFEMLLFLQWK
jgi:hypothetical protein